MFRWSLRDGVRIYLDDEFFCAIDENGQTELPDPSLVNMVLFVRIRQQINEGKTEGKISVKINPH